MHLLELIASLSFPLVAVFRPLGIASDCIYRRLGNFAWARAWEIPFPRTKYISFLVC